MFTLPQRLREVLVKADGTGFRSARRLAAYLIRDVLQGGLDVQAASLVYTTLLSLAPLLAVSFSVLKAFGAHNELRPFLLQMLGPLGGEGPELAGRIIGFVNNLEVGVLGFAGFALLFFTVLSLLQKIEDCCNRIWRVRQCRSLRRRFSDYLSVLLVGPALVFSALGLMASMASHRIVQTLIALEPFGTLYYLLGRLLPTLLMMAAFTFLYLFIPNTRVRFKAALAGGIAAGLAWRLAGWLFAKFVAGSAQYAAIYSGFAILIVFMIWLYVNSLILLLGVDLAFYLQHPRALAFAPGSHRVGSARFRRTGLSVMVLLARRFHRGGPPWTAAELADRLRLPDEAIESVLQTLRRRGLVVAVDSAEPAFLPGREPGALAVADILEALESDPAEDAPETGAPAEPAVDRILRVLSDAGETAIREISLKSLAEAED